MFRSKFVAAAVAAACIFSAVPQASAQVQGRYYRLTNDFLGASQALDVAQLPAGLWYGRALQTGTGSGQNWHFTPLGGGWFRMTNQWNNVGACLDVAGDGSTYMDTCGAQIGQRWRIERRNGALVILNAFTPGKCLDVTSDPGTHIAVLTPCANLTGQRWTLTESGVPYP